MKETYYNPNSKRKNIFRAVYDSPHFKDILKRREEIPRFPFLVDIEITNYCNLDCVFCARRLMTRKKGYMGEDIFKKVVDECARYNTPVRLIRWGEPFLHPRFMSFVQYVKRQKNIPLHITTNGLLLDEKKAESLVEWELDSLIFSFQGATPQEYALMRNNQQYALLKKNILRLIEIRGERVKPYVHVSTTVTDETEEQIAGFMHYWGKLADCVSIGKTNLTQLLLFPERQPGESMDRIRQLLPKETIEKTYQPCKEVYQKLSVNYDGTVSACCADFDDLLLVGDIKTDSMGNIWNKSKRLKLFRHLLDDMQHTVLTLCRACYPTVKV